jgi:hypothetical protein
VNIQVEETKKRKGAPDLDALISGGETWKIT